MGYRSQIGAVLSIDEWSGNEAGNPEAQQWVKYKEMIGLIKLSKFYELMQQAETDRECIGWHWGEFYFKADGWKWYPDYEVVQAWEELWEQMQEVEGVSGYFCRVGEEVNDIEEEHFGDQPDYEAFYPRTEMNCEVSKEVFGDGDIDKEIENLTMLEGEAK